MFEAYGSLYTRSKRTAQRIRVAVELNGSQSILDLELETKRTRRRRQRKRTKIDGGRASL